MIKKIKESIQSWIWFFEDRCYYCGGETYQWSTDREYCKVCNKRV